VLSIAVALFSAVTFAAGNTLVPGDTNSRVTVENAVVKGNETTVFFLTWPYLGDPNSGKTCPLNYYSVTLKPGLPTARADVVAKGVCGGLFQKSRLLDNGEALIIIRDRLERWQSGEQIRSDSFSDFDAASKLRVTTDDMGGQFYDVSPSGDVVLAIPVSGYISQNFPDSNLVLAGLKLNGEQRWEQQLSDVGQYFTIERLWAAQDGGALLKITTHSTDSMIPVDEPQLRIISNDGKQKQLKLTRAGEPFDAASIRPGSQADMERFYEHQRNAKPESIETVGAKAREGGGFDVLFHRSGGTEGREGHFLYRLGADGALFSEISLGNHIQEHGLEDWFDFYIDRDQLILLSRVMATQQGVQSRRKKWMQNAVSWVDLDTGVPLTRLIPLDERYLEAAMNSGDEDRKNLEGLPGGDPVLLTSVDGVPLVVSLGVIGGRFTLRLNEATEQLLVFTEAVDQRNAKLAKERASQQRKTDREARKQQMSDDMAAAAGLSPEDYAALSNRKQKEAMVREGDMDAMMAAVMKQAEAAQQSAAASGASPEQLAQMEAAMAQARQMMQGGGYGVAMPGSAPAVEAPEAEASVQVLSVDTQLRGHIQFKNRDGKLTTMVVFNRKTGEELLKKEYVDGVIDEYVNFGRYKLPLEQIGIVIRNVSGEILEELTPKPSR
jgi:hypothetical protein